MNITYAPIIPGLTINGKDAPYPVLNERSIRATAGLMFAVGLTTFLYIFLTRDYTPLFYIVPLFWADFFIKVFVTPRLSPFGIIGELLVKNQKPEYVGAVQKRFAWSLGLFLATVMMILAVFLNVRGAVPFAICLTCLLFMWLESAAGICVGCKIYYFLVNKGLIQKPEHRPACPGGVCEVPDQKS